LIDLDEKQIKVVGLLEVLGAFGLILPALLNIYPVLSAISALCLSLTMIVAGRINYKLKLPIIPNIVIFVICILIVYLQLK
jgi:DoxX-like family